MSLMTAEVSRASVREAHALMVRARGECEPVLRAAVELVPDPLSTMAGYHLGWWDAQRRAIAGASGKSIRAALTLGAAAACGGGGGDAAKVAAAIELVHNFTLLHDDVMDGDSTRRGRATVWRVWGVGNAILLGDALHALAIRVLTELPEGSVAVKAAARLEASCVDLCIGQFEDCSFEGQKEVTVDDYLRMAGRKTAVLMGGACALGALSAGADDATVSAMDRFGYELGLAFQFVDDLIGIWGDSAVTGKPVGNDLARRKATLPVVAALNSSCEAANELAQLYKSNQAMTPDEIARATALVEAAGGREAAQRDADERIHAAIAALPEQVRSAELVGLAQLVIERNR
jgi:geranylgeranyl diphosphate synthase, type I